MTGRWGEKQKRKKKKEEWKSTSPALTVSWLHLDWPVHLCNTERRTREGRDRTDRKKGKRQEKTLDLKHKNSEAFTFAVSIGMVAYESFVCIYCII